MSAKKLIEFSMLEELIEVCILCSALGICCSHGFLEVHWYGYGDSWFPKDLKRLLNFFIQRVYKLTSQFPSKEKSSDLGTLSVAFFPVKRCVILVVISYVL